MATPRAVALLVVVSALVAHAVSRVEEVTALDEVQVRDAARTVQKDVGKIVDEATMARGLYDDAMMEELGEASDSLKCPQNYGKTSSGANEFTCTRCTAGKADASQTGTCANCTAGQSSSAGEACTACGSNTVAAAGAAPCSACAANSAPNANKDACVCSAGHGKSGSSTTCEACAKGQFSAAASDSCNACGDNEVAAEGATACTTCATNSQPSSDKDVCVCSGGYGKPSGSSDCNQCGKGQFSPVGNTACADCADNEVATAGSASCTACSGNTVRNGDKDACVCAGGYGKSSDSCQQCAKGQFSPEGDTACAACSDGHYSNNAGAASCTSVPANSSPNQAKDDFECNAGYVKDTTTTPPSCKIPSDWTVKYMTGLNCKCENGNAVGNAAKSKANKGTFHLAFRDGSNTRFTASFTNPCDNLSSCSSKDSLTQATTNGSGQTGLFGNTPVTVMPDITNGNNGWCIGDIELSSASRGKKYTWTATDANDGKKKGWINKSGGKCAHTLSAITLTGPHDI